MFPELVSPLTEAFERAPDGAVYVITKHRSQAEFPAGWRNSNLRTRFEKIIYRAGLEPWPKLFHAMRASFETELIERFPVQTVTAWLGHSPKVALRHYLRVLPEHFDKAVEGDASSLQNPVQYAPESGRKALQAKQKTPIFPEECEALRHCTGVQTDGEGFEPPAYSTGKTGDSQESGAESGALDAENGPKDPDLGAMIDAWPKLPEAIKAGILAMVRAAGIND